MAKRTIAIGDIHGCSTALKTLLAAIAPQHEDTIVALGDYVDRGPDARGVIDILIALVDQCEVVPLLGNHELMMLQATEDEETLMFWRSCGGAATLASYGGSFDKVPLEHWVFLRGLRLFYETEGFLFVHANYHPHLPLEQTSDDLLLWQHISSRAPPQHVSGKTVVVGHTPQGSGDVLDLGHLICLDTYCFGGRWLTAMDVESGKIWQADQRGQLRNA